MFFLPNRVYVVMVLQCELSALNPKERNKKLGGIPTRVQGIPKQGLTVSQYQAFKDVQSRMLKL
jgi:hypothetical protein